MLNRRWYDKNTKAQSAIELLKELDAKSQEVISRNVVDVVNSIKTVRKEEEIIPLSIGIKRVLGLYKTTEAKRWYDKNTHIDQVFKTLSTLPKEDFENVIEGICTSLKS